MGVHWCASARVCVFFWPGANVHFGTSAISVWLTCATCAMRARSRVSRRARMLARVQRKANTHACRSGASIVRFISTQFEYERRSERSDSEFLVHTHLASIRAYIVRVGGHTDSSDSWFVCLLCVFVSVLCSSLCAPVCGINNQHQITARARANIKRIPHRISIATNTP